MTPPERWRSIRKGRSGRRSVPARRGHPGPAGASTCRSCCAGAGSCDYRHERWRADWGAEYPHDRGTRRLVKTLCAFVGAEPLPGIEHIIPLEPAEGAACRPPLSFLSATAGQLFPSVNYAEVASVQSGDGAQARRGDPASFSLQAVPNVRCIKFNVIGELSRHGFRLGFDQGGLLPPPLWFPRTAPPPRSGFFLVGLSGLNLNICTGCPSSAGLALIFGPPHLNSIRTSSRRDFAHAD
jgi:hypothetical protein